MTSAKARARDVRRAAGLRLRRDGHSYREIARRLGVSVKTSFFDVRAAREAARCARDA